LVVVGPVALALVGATPLGNGRAAAARTCTAAIAAAAVALATAIATAVATANVGTASTPLLGSAGIGFSCRLDGLSATMFCLVSFIGLVVVLYSRNYLDGDPGHARFMRALCLTLASVLLIIVSGNLFAFTLAWIATSVALNRLLLFYPERPAARLAASKEWIASRLGDLCLIAAACALYARFGSLEYGVLFTGADALRMSGTDPGLLHLVALLLVVTALLKSAQFPLHGWLVEVMETPTPVSALLHAGIVNAGGFLILRFSHVIALSGSALDTLVLVGGFTALFGSIVMLTQTSIKSSLAHSTIAQMGFMMLECGLAAFPAALLHVVAHSLYKAHAFLSSGSVIDIARSSWTPGPNDRPHPLRFFIALAGVFAVALVIGSLFGFRLGERPGEFALAAALMLGVIHLVANGIDETPSGFVLVRTFGFAALVAAVYFGLQSGAAIAYASVLPQIVALRDPVGVSVVAVVVTSFALVTFVQTRLPPVSRDPRWNALYAHVSNGLYVNTFANRLVLRFMHDPAGR
jgi:NAD(P)H-quinone oxidoreductase subunit 5